MTESSPSLDTPSLSPAHQSQTTLSPSSLSPAHMTTHPAHVTPPPPGHMAPYPMQLPPHPIHGMPPPGSIQPYPLQRPPSQMPHPHFLRGGMQQQFPWLMRGNYMPPPPPPGGLAHIPPPNIPLLGPHIRPFGEWRGMKINNNCNIMVAIKNSLVSFMQNINCKEWCKFLQEGRSLTYFQAG